MADLADPSPTPPLYRAIPVLEVADDPPAPPPILDVLPANEPPTAILDALPAEEPPQRRPDNPAAVVFRLIARGVRVVGSVLEWLFGAAVLTVGLAVLAALPLLQFLSLGYLLE